MLHDARRLARPAPLVAVLCVLALLTTVQSAAAGPKLRGATRGRVPGYGDAADLFGRPAPPAPANVAAMLAAADESVARDAEIAQATSSNPQVLDFASTLAADHTALETSAVAWMKSHAIEPVESPASDALVTAGVEGRKAFEPQQGAAFDGAFARQEVRYGRTLLAALNDTMIPGASDSQLASLLETARSEVKTHVERGEELERSLGA